MRLLAILLLSALLPAQQGHREPPDDGGEQHEWDCEGCENRSGPMLLSSPQELWQFIPGYYNGNGNCYSGCYWRGCRNSGKMKFTNGHLGSVLIGGAPSEFRTVYFNGSYVGTYSNMQSTGWKKIAVTVGCGQNPGPKALAFDMMNTSAGPTSGWFFLCEDCWPTDDDGGGDDRDDGEIRR